MAEFLSDLFQSIFVAGAPPALMLATNASFALLQIVLFVLIFVSGSIHFVLLSLICAGLWAAINWFVAELEKVREVEAKAGRLRENTKEYERIHQEGYEGGEDEDGEEDSGGGGGGGESVVGGIPGEWGKGSEGGLGVDIDEARGMRDDTPGIGSFGGGRSGGDASDGGGGGGGLAMDTRTSSRASAAHAVTDDEGSEDMLRIEHGRGSGSGVATSLEAEGTVRDRGRRGRLGVEELSTEGETTEEEEGYEKIGMDEGLEGLKSGKKRR